MSSNRLLFPHHKRTFSTQSAFWIALIGGLLLTGVSTFAHVKSDWSLDTDYHIVYSFTSNFLLLFVAFIYNFAIIKRAIPSLWKYLFGIVGTLLITAILSSFSLWLQRLIYDDSHFSDPASINMTRDVIVATVAILVSIILFNITRRNQLSIEKEQLQTEILMMRYEALENQLDPHFLFNSLNTLSGLIGIDDQKARQYLQHLASTYRYIMQGKRLVPLDQELLFVDNYCQMMMIRYGDNLRIEKHIDKAFQPYMIIPISVQLLIENAIKHNIISQRHPLVITLESTLQGTFRVSNPIVPKQEEQDGTGLGLINLSKRYQLLCGKNIEISKRDNIFAVEVPLIHPAQAQKLLLSNQNQSPLKPHKS